MKKLIHTIVLLTVSFTVFGQENDVASSKSYMSRESFTRIYKVAAESGYFGKEDGKYTLDASLFGLKALVNPEVKVDTNYLENSNAFLRRVQLTMSMGLGDQNKIESFAPGVKVALINNRDMTNGSLRKTTSSLISMVGRSMVNAISKYSKANDESFKKLIKKYQDEESVELSDFDGEFQDLFNAEWKSQIESLKNDPIYEFIQSRLDSINLGNFNEYVQKEWDYEKERFSRRALLTAAVLPSFESGNLNDMSLEVSFLQGLNPNKVKKSPANLELKAAYVFSNDTVIAEDSFDERRLWKVDGNFGKVLWKDEENDSKLELKLGVGYQSISRGLREDEDESVFTLNFSLTPRLTEDLYFPIELKYDPENANILGKFSLTWNLNPED